MFSSFSWLPSLPSIDFALPAAIQKRFISFALRQSLGHFLKPGQFDVQQVDSQIGSGYVQVRDLELNNEAINALISALPIRLHDGSLGKVTARIPWPNPLTSSVGLSLESLHLTFYLEPNVVPKDERPFVDSLAESVASVAETFIHEELTPNEEATLRESIHPEFSSPSQKRSEEHVPGGLDPFMSEEEVHFSDADPPGVSIFATLIERLLARFQFDATDTRITIVNPGQACFTLIIPDIRYGTQSQDSSSRSSNTDASKSPRTTLTGEVRKVSISGITLTTRCLRPMSPHPLTPCSPVLTPKTLSPTMSHTGLSASQMSVSVTALDVQPHDTGEEPFNEAPGEPYEPTAMDPPPNLEDSIHIVVDQGAGTIEPSSPYSDSSDMDEDIQMFMSQSIALLPPRPVSPTSSVASSMYQSAVSTGGEVALDDIPEENSVHSRSATPPAEPSPPPSPLQSASASTPNSPEPSPRPSPRPSPPSYPPLSSPQQTSIEDVVPDLQPMPHSIPQLVQDVVQDPATKDETILSFGSEPIELRLTTPPPFRAAETPSSEASAPKSTQPEAARPLAGYEKVRVDVSMGIIACAFNARQIRSIIDAVELWTSHSAPFILPTAPDASGKVAGSSPIPLDDIEGTIYCRGLIFLLLPALRTSASGPDDALTEFFARPLVPPHLPRGYGRLHLETVSCSFTSKRDGPTGSKRGSSKKPVLPSMTELSASPILISDPNLPSQYHVAHIHPTLVPSSVESSSVLPTFDIIDWTAPTQRSSAAKLSMWRTRASQPPSRGHRKSSSSPVQHRIPVALPSSPGRLGLAGLSSPSSRTIQDATKSYAPAIAVMFRSAASPAEAAEVNMSLAPLHVFVDAGMLLSPREHDKSEFLQFVEEITAPSRQYSPTVAGAGGDEDGAVLDIRMKNVQLLHALEQERERRRLERLVLEDLDLGFDYREQRKSPTTPTRRSKRRTERSSPSTIVTVNLPALRVEIRTPPPKTKDPRSGAVVLDIHDLRLSPGSPPEQDSGPKARFGTAEEIFNADASGPKPDGLGSVLLGASWQRIVVAYVPLNASKARTLLSLGSLSNSSGGDEAGFGVGSPPAREPSTPGLRPQLIVSRVGLGPLAASIDIPSIHVELSKPTIDGLQLWADDLTQLTEAAFSEQPGSGANSQKGGSGDSSLIGSRYFARASTVGSGTESGATSLANTIRAKKEPRSETAVKIAVTEAVLRLLAPREQAGAVVRPFDITASDVDVLLELKPEGKDETVVTVGVSELNIFDTTSADRCCYLSLTSPRSWSVTARSALKLRFTSLIVPETTAKESRVRLTVSGITYTFYPDISWAEDLGRFFKAPPGAFESVVPSERTRINLKVHDTSIRLFAPTHKGALLPYIEEAELSTVIEGNAPTVSMNLSVTSFLLLFIDDLSGNQDEPGTPRRPTGSGVTYWKKFGYALVVELNELALILKQDTSLKPPDIRLFIDRGDLRLHMCADTMAAVGAFGGDLASAFRPPVVESSEPKRKREPARVNDKPTPSRGLLASLDEYAFRRLPEVGAAPDMIDDDLPTNPDYLDESFGAAAGLREISDDEFDESDLESSFVAAGGGATAGASSAFGGETIRMLRPEGLHIVENYFETLPPNPGEASSFGDTTFQARVKDFDVTVNLYDGYDWVRTRKIIEEKAKEMRRRLAKIRQLRRRNDTLLFNSVYIGLEHNIDELEPGALIAAIDEELNEEFETNTQSSWQSLKPQPLASPGRGGSQASKPHKRRLHRSKGPSIEIRLMTIRAEFDQVFATVQDLEILDHIKTSTWKKFLTSLRADSRGNVRETDSNMVRVELRMLHPVPGHPSQEARLRAKILPLRLHVDQDALDFLKQFFAFQDPDAAPLKETDPADDIYFQQAEVFPVDLKLDYKPRRVDYRALRDGRTIELMNFFHFDGAEMTLRHITLKGITGWPRFFDLLNDLWTPDVKATQLVDVISGVAPIRSVVNVGSGVADLVLLPIAQYKKDGRVYLGLQKGTNAFMKSTAMEAIRLGARLATGTQVILEQAEGVLGNQFKDSVTAETVQSPVTVDIDDMELDEDTRDLISKYAEQPSNVKEGMQSAYRSLKRNLNSAAQTILAVPMEVYERSGNEGAVRAVVRAVPIAVLKPMIGATEAVSKTLLGLQNTLDPNIRQENEAKYKQR
ncbi:uncharacterized protein BXZ73DRAFT_86295 [Epithele typhae]|uniref:uncharacterized protein n=1 Tax=Epithele typhae TaxID=378194 RepID=UPI0020079C22|nr:uncharacterized protein BXZ73DRAFT_86295 [Epithele typhae]KAH9946106.1 hypothetical protein BXZ73DRAFT_86295 [Epithele typhae]